MISNNLFIIARCNEDIQWVEKLPGNIIIYNKGDNFPYGYPKIDLPNIGRESETFVRSIVENYDYLNNVDNLVFLQGNPFDHCPNLFDLINNPEIYNQGVFPLTKAFCKHSSSNFDFIFGKHPLILEKILDVKKTVVKIEMNNLITNEIYSAENEYYEFISILDILKIPYNNVESFWATGAQYIVSKELILNKSLEWWSNLLKFIHYCEIYLKWPNLPYILERIWPLIWTHST